MKILFGGLERDLAENVKANESNRSVKWGYGVISSQKKTFIVIIFLTYCWESHIWRHMTW
jgi:hypothetical protein